MRQFEYTCELVGVTPKRYDGANRVPDAALRASLAVPKRAWTDIAHEIGYYDQMHGA